MLLLGDSAKVLKDFKDEYIDLTVTSPPYDNLRTYDGNSEFDFNEIAKQLYRVTKQGGVVVWVVGDRTKDGDETGTSFRQALYFKEIGFRLHDTMIYTTNPRYPDSTRYSHAFQYMFVLSKGKPKTFNPIKDRKNKHAGESRTCTNRNADGSFRDDYIKSFNEFGIRYNIWFYNSAYMQGTNDKIAYSHPAIFPDKLAHDHILSWSNEGDTVLDPFCGSGTTCKMAKILNRKYIGIEVNPEYLDIAKMRIETLLPSG